MKKISYQKMANLVVAKRKEQKLTQAQLAEMTGIHRAMVSRLEALDYIPSIDQLQAVAEALGFEVTDLFEEENPVFPYISDINDIETEAGDIVRNISVNIRFYEGWDE